MVHFGEVVVGGGKPEDRNGIYAAGGRLCSELHRSQRLEQGKRGPAEKPYLLPGDGDPCTGAEARDMGQRLLRRSPILILTLQRGSYTLKATAVVDDLPSLIAEPGAEVRRARVKRGKLGRVAQE